MMNCSKVGFFLEMQTLVNLLSDIGQIIKNSNISLSKFRVPYTNVQTTREVPMTMRKSV